MGLPTPPSWVWEQVVPGTALLYQGTGFFSWAIRVKTWAPVSHIEVYMGHDVAYASRDGVGVRSFPMRRDRLFAVLNPLEPFDAEHATAWHNTVVGQSYDWTGLFRFFTLGKQSTTKQFCSEYATRLYRTAGMHPFAERYDADLVSPGMFLSSPHFTTVWCATDEYPT